MANLVAVQNPPSADSPPSPSDELSAWDSFWLLYPRHVAKLAAKKAWAKIDAAQHVPILTALVAWRQVWRDKDPEYIPHPASWLNGERWEDELPAGFTAKPSARPETGPPRDDQAVQVRQTIPEHVKTVLARLQIVNKEKARRTSAGRIS